MSSRVPLTEIELQLQETAKGVAEKVLKEGSVPGASHSLNPDAQLFTPHGEVKPQPPSYEEACEQLRRERQLAVQTASPNHHHHPPQWQRQYPAAARSHVPAFRSPVVLYWC
jgi:hypothetical protein